MTSMIYVKRPGGTVKVHDKDVINNIVVDGEKEKTDLDLKKIGRRPKKADARVSSAPDTASSGSVDSKSLIGHSLRVQDWLNEKTIKELQERADHESHAAKRLYTPFLETEATFVKDVGEFLEHKDLVDLRKKEVLHKRWSDQVYEPIRRKILTAIDGADWRHLDRRKRELHRQFLEHVNRRGHVFLDDDDTEEYYAQALNGHRPAPIKIRTQALNDPLLTLSKQRAEEDRIILRCMTGHRYSDRDIEQVRLPPLPLIPLGRHGVNSCKWLEMPLHNIESTPRERSRRRMWGISTKTEIDFGTWSKAGYDPKVAEHELQIPRKRMYAEQPPYGKPPAEIPHAPFIDPEDWSDKIINSNPFDAHVQNVIADEEARKAFYEYQQQVYAAQEQQEHQQLEQQPLQQQQPLLVES